MADYDVKVFLEECTKDNEWVNGYKQGRAEE